MSFVETAVVNRGYRVLSLLVMSFRVQWYFFAIPAIYLFTNWLMLSRLATYREAPVIAVLMDLLSFALPVGIIVMLLLRLYQYVAIEKPESPVKALLSDTSGLFTRPAMIINALPVFAAMIFFNKAMIELKPAIPMINPFSWDLTFMEWDRGLHFGVEPWALLQPLLGYDLSPSPSTWPIISGSWRCSGHGSGSASARMRESCAPGFSSPTCWPGGSAAACWLCVFSSAGPVYYDELGLTPDPYTGAFRLPQRCQHPHSAVVPRYSADALGRLYRQGSRRFGISAMPSMHNASAVLFALAFRQVSKRAWMVLHAVCGDNPRRLGASWLALCHRWLCWHRHCRIQLVAGRTNGALGHQPAARNSLQRRSGFALIRTCWWDRTPPVQEGAPCPPIRQDLDKNPANYQPLTPLSFLARSAAVYPDHVAIIHGTARVNYAQFYARCRQLASSLAKAGIRKGDTVSVLLANTPAMLECHYGVPMTGAVLNTLNTRLDAANIAFCWTHAETRILIVDKEFSKLASEALALMTSAASDRHRLRRSRICVEGERVGSIDYEQFLSSGDAGFEWLWPADEWDAISLNYTSGTTGNPKGVVYHHRGAYLLGQGNILTGAMPKHAGLSLDTADVPLQRLVFPVVDLGRWRDPCDTALGPVQVDLGRARGTQGHASMWRAHCHVDDHRCARK